MTQPRPAAPKIKTINDIKGSLLHPALTSHFECFFSIPDTFASDRQGKVKDFIQRSVPVNTELLTLSCSEASLPGSNLATVELNNDFTGVTQRHAYRRLYDDRADFTFYVDNRYSQILLFERWMQFITGEQIAQSANLNSYYRMMYPKTYKTTIYITKFERSARSKTGKDRQNETNGSYQGSSVYYTFFNAFPISITSMPVSYDSSSLLKCTVSFTYDRYVVSPQPLIAQQGEPGQTPAIGVANPNDIAYSNGQVITNAFAGNASISGNYFNNVSPNQFNLSSGSLTNSGEGGEIINAITANSREVEAGLPYVGRNKGRGPIARFSGI